MRMLPPDRVIASEPPTVTRSITQLERSFRRMRRVGGFDPDLRPAPPENVTQTITVREAKVRLEYRVKVHCDFLTADTCEADIKRYIFQIRRTNAAGAPIDGTNKRTLELTHKQAFDTDSELPHVIFNDLEKPKSQYVQSRARILDKDERFSDWSDWTAHELPVQSALPKPPAPGNLQLDFFSTREKNSATRWIGRVRGNEVTDWDAPGGDHEEDVAAYIVQVQTSDDGIVGNDKMQHFYKPAKDEDADTVWHLTFLIRHRRYWKRARAKTVDRWGRKGDWGSWTSWQRPGQEEPPNSTAVTIFDNSVDQVIIDWDSPPDPADPDVIHIDVAYAQAQISKSPTFTPIFKKDLKILGSRRAFFIPKADRGATFYGRTRNASADDEFGEWIPARLLGNDNPSADPDGVKVKSPRYTMAWTINGDAQAKMYKQLHPVPFDSKIIGAMMRADEHDAATHPNDGCPTGSALEANLRIWDADDGTNRKVFDTDARLKIPASRHRDTVFLDDGDPSWSNQLVFKGESVGVRIAAIGSGNPGSNVVIVATLEPV